MCVATYPGRQIAVQKNELRASLAMRCCFGHLHFDSKAIAMKDEEDPVVDEMQCRSPNTGSLGGVKMPDHSDKQSNTGCLILFLLAFPVIDTIGVLIPLAQPYSQAVERLGLGGFACGAALGVYVSVKIKHKPWWSSCRWAIYGLLGACLIVIIAFQVVIRCR